MSPIANWYCEHPLVNTILSLALIALAVANLILLYVHSKKICQVYALKELAKKLIEGLEYDTLKTEMESYLRKGFYNLTPDEERRLVVISKEIAAYEEKHYPMPFNPQ